MTWLFIIAGLLAVLDWYAVSVENKRIEYFAKPAALTILIIAYASLLKYPPGLPEIIFGLGLIFSLGGDVFLMLPGDQFIKGLIAFLLAQIGYIIVFNVEGILLNLTTILMAIAIALIAFPVIGSIARALREKDRSSLVVPVLIYGFFLSLMFWSGAVSLYRPGWTRLSAGLTALGGAAFFISDSILAWDRFAAPIKRARLLTMFTYHLAQFALTLGILLHWGYF